MSLTLKRSDLKCVECSGCAFDDRPEPWLDGKKKWYIAANDYATAKIEDVLALEEGDPEERPITAEDILGIGAKK